MRRNQSNPAGGNAKSAEHRHHLRIHADDPVKPPKNEAAQRAGARGLSFFGRRVPPEWKVSTVLFHGMSEQN
jgi:hypothetical protein